MRQTKCNKIVRQSKCNNDLRRVAVTLSFHLKIDFRGAQKQKVVKGYKMVYNRQTKNVQLHLGAKGCILT